MNPQTVKKQKSVLAWVIHVFVIVTALFSLFTLSFSGVFKTDTEADLIFNFGLIGLYAVISMLVVVIFVLSLIFMLIHKFKIRPHSYIIAGYLLIIAIYSWVSLVF